IGSSGTSDALIVGGRALGLIANRQCIRCDAFRACAQPSLRTKWSEREDLNLRPLVSQTSALTGLRHAPNVVPLARIAGSRKASGTILVFAHGTRNRPQHDETRAQPSFSARSSISRQATRSLSARP